MVIIPRAATAFTMPSAMVSDALSPFLTKIPMLMASPARVFKLPSKAITRAKNTACFSGGISPASESHPSASPHRSTNASTRQCFHLLLMV